jgi:acetyltransferase-like isoleucine patch superfamily enzyme
MIVSNIFLGSNVQVDTSAKMNNAKIGDEVKIAAQVNVFGAASHLIEVGEATYIGPFSMLEGYNAPVKIGCHVSIAQRVTILSGSAPNGSEQMQRIFPAIKGPVSIGDHTWIGAHAVIMPNVELGKFCVVAANSFVNRSFPDYAVIGGTPAKLIRILNDNEIALLND